MSDSDYRTKKIEVPFEDIIDFICMDNSVYDLFLDYLSEKHCGSIMLMDIDMVEVQPLVLEVTGDISEAINDDRYIEDYGQETIWDICKDEPDAFK